MQITRKDLESVMDPSDKTFNSEALSDLLTAMQLLTQVVRHARVANGKSVTVDIPNSLFEEIDFRVQAFDSGVVFSSHH